jgi:putative membrane protein
MKILLSLILSTLAVFITAQIVPGVQVSSVTTAFIVAVVLGIINAFIRPILLILTLPINILTLGLFTLVIMAICVLLASAIVPGFQVNGFWWAMLFAIVLAIINSFLNALGGPEA